MEPGAAVPSSCWNTASFVKEKETDRETDIKAKDDDNPVIS